MKNARLLQALLAARSEPLPYFDFDPSVAGLSNVGTDITINGTTLSPVLAYSGADATPADWPAIVGPTLTAQNVGAGSISFGNSVPWNNDTDKAVVTSGAPLQRYIGTVDLSFSSDFLYVFIGRSDNPGTTPTAFALSNDTASNYIRGFCVTPGGQNVGFNFKDGTINRFSNFTNPYGGQITGSGWFVAVVSADVDRDNYVSINGFCPEDRTWNKNARPDRS